MASVMTGVLVFLGVLFERVFVSALERSLEVWEFWGFLSAIGVRFLLTLLPQPYDMAADIILIVVAIGFFGLVHMCEQPRGATYLRTQVAFLLITCLGSGIGMVSGALVFRRSPWFFAHLNAVPVA